VWESRTPPDNLSVQGHPARGGPELRHGPFFASSRASRQKKTPTTRKAERADLELVLLDGDDELLAAGWGVPIRWDGDPLTEIERIATVAEWEQWTGLVFPDSGDYVIPDGLAPLRVDRELDQGTHTEPNLWFRHRQGRSRDRRSHHRGGDAVRVRQEEAPPATGRRGFSERESGGRQDGSGPQMKRGSAE
ncbi:hypothetical protein AB0J51_29785, partial [Micromonospora echinofusca]